MQIYTLKQIYDLAGCYDLDGDLERDLKVSAYLNKRKYRVVEQWTAETLVDPEIDIIIVKGNTNGRKQS